MNISRIAIMALALTFTLGTASAALAWHGDNGYGGHGGRHNGGHMMKADGTGPNGGTSGCPYYTGTRHVGMKNGPYVDYVAPHRVNDNCAGMTGPHGRHITEAAPTTDTPAKP